MPEAVGARRAAGGRGVDSSGRVPPPGRRASGSDGRAARPPIALAVAVSLGLAGCWVAESTDVRDGADPGALFTSQVQEILRLSAEAWNAGDLDGFMVHYERSPATTYIGSGGLRVGYDAIRERYAPRFEAGAARDSLRFEEVAGRRLGQRHGLATARYVLHRGSETTSTGLFTLVLVLVEGRWKIIHDQSAADPPVEPSVQASDTPSSQPSSQPEGPAADRGNGPPPEQREAASEGGAPPRA